MKARGVGLSNWIWILATFGYLLMGIFGILNWNGFDGQSSLSFLSFLFSFFAWSVLPVPAQLISRIPFAANQAASPALLVTGLIAIALAALSFVAMWRIKKNRNWAFVFLGLALAALGISIGNAAFGEVPLFSNFVASALLIVSSVDLYRNEQLTAREHSS